MADKWNGFRGAAKQIEDRDIGRIAHMIDVGEDELHAFMDVEAAGEGFDSLGRPKALYEPHVAYRNAHGAVRDKLVKAGLAYPKWKKGYPKDSYARIKAALAIDETVALKATSWGFGQVLGENHHMAGYATVQEMVKAMMADEENHLIAMVEFAKSAHIDDDLRLLSKLKRRTTPADCVAIVRVYNGAGYKANNYDTKFATAHNKWRGIRDTPWEEDRVVDHEIEDVAEDDLYDGKYHDAVFNAQKRLDEIGYPEVGTVDGKWGRKTQTAVLAFRAENGLSISTKIDDAFLSALMSAPPREIDTARKTTTVADLREAGAKDVIVADQTQTAGAVAGGVGLIGGAGTMLNSLDGYGSFFTTISNAIEPIQDFIKDYFWVLALGVGAFVIWKSGILKRIRVEKHQNGQDVSQ